METQQEKVYIAVGKNVEEGLGLLKWALNHWSSQPISFIILHINASSKFFVQTPFGKLPRRSLSDEKLEVFRAKEQERVDKLMSKYMAICCKVEAQVLKVDAYEEPIHKILVEQIAKFGIKKLVMGFKNTRTLSWKPKSDTSESCCVHKHKPDFCELFIVSGGKRLLLQEENGDGVYFVDESGEIVTNFRKKSKGTFKGWLGRKLTDNASNSADDPRPSSHHVLSPSNAEVVIHKWEDEAEEVERYIECLLAASSTELEQGDDSMDQHEVANTITHQSSLDKTEALRAIAQAEKMVEENKNEAKAEEERRRKAEQIISLCNQHADDLEANLREEMAKLVNLKEEQDSLSDEMKNVFHSMTDNKNNLTLELDQKGELLIKLNSNSIEKSWVEAEMANTESKRVEILREMEEIRRQTEFARRRLEYYKEREAMTTTNGLAYEYREFSEEELRDATDGFSEKMMIIEGSEGAVYRGRIHRTSVAIKLKIADVQSLEEFKAQVKLLSQSNHPHIVTMIGVCTELRCIVFEYMNHGSLLNILFPSSRNNQHLILPWHSRIRIISNLCSAFAFLHASQPIPTVHGRLDSSHVLLDHNLTAKITGFLTISSASPAADIKALGLLVLQLLTGIQEVDFQQMREVVEEGTIEMVLDQRAGDWPINLAWEFARIGLRCFEEGNADEEEGVMLMGEVMNEVEYLREEAERKLLYEGDNHREVDMPDVFLCPIFQEVMKDPHVAADGFSYELEAINEWLKSGHETSPMTNLKLNNKRLTPNHTLQSLIRNSHRNYS